MIHALLHRLDAHHYTSGESLAAEQGCTRAAISKQVEQLREHGVLIESRPRHGYRFSHPYRWWGEQDAAALSRRLAMPVVWLPSVDSTSEWLRRQSSRDDGLMLAITDFQLSGKGRRGRQWLTPPGRQLTFTLGCRAAHAPGRWLGVALAAGVALAQVLRRRGWPVSLKWPNDLMLGESKLGGILIEMDAMAEGPSHLLLGVGINESLLHDERAALDRPVAALQDAPITYERADLLADLVTSLQTVLQQYPETGLEAWRGAWQYLDCLQGKTVSFQQGDLVHDGVAEGIDAQGSLMVRTVHGVVACHSGEVVWR